MTTCPFYRNGLCISPKLEEATDVVTAPNRCFGDFETCKYYVEKKASVKLESLIPSGGLVYYDKVNVIYDKELLDKIDETQCMYFQYSNVDTRYGKGAVAYCSVLRRLLTASQGKNCILYAKTCPLNKR